MDRAGIVHSDCVAIDVSGINEAQKGKRIVDAFFASNSAWWQAAEFDQ
jgi:hypothetical protein